MASSNDIFLGFDPGGKNGFGAAMLVGSDGATVTVSTVAEAIAWAVGQCGDSVPVAAGVDTLLHWCDGPSGWRPADRWLRQTYPGSAISVASVNSLYGGRGHGISSNRLLKKGLSRRERIGFPVLIVSHDEGPDARRRLPQ